MTLATGLVTPIIRDVFAMQKDSRIPTSIQMIGHCFMGAILGSLLGLALILTNQNIFQFIATSQSPSMEMAVFVGFFSFIIGIGSTISGFFFIALELNSLKAKQQRANQRQGPDRLN